VRDTKDLLSYPVHLPAKAAAFCVNAVTTVSFREDLNVSSASASDGRVIERLEDRTVANFPLYAASFFLPCLSPALSAWMRNGNKWRKILIQVLTFLLSAFQACDNAELAACSVSGMQVC